MSQHFLLPCSCGQKLRVTTAQAGGQVSCACGQSLTVPTLRGLRALEPAAAEAAGKSAPGWSVLHGLFFSGGLLLIVAGIALLAFNLNRYWQVAGYTVDHTDSVVAAHTAEIDRLTAVQLFDEWSNVKGQGLGEKSMPPWEAAKQYVAGNLFWMKAGGGAIAVGLLLSVLSLFVARPARA